MMETKFKNISKRNRDVAMNAISQYDLDRKPGHEIAAEYLYYHGLPKSVDAVQVCETLAAMGLIDSPMVKRMVASSSQLQINGNAIFKSRKKRNGNFVTIGELLSFLPYPVRCFLNHCGHFCGGLLNICWGKIVTADFLLAHTDVLTTAKREGYAVFAESTFIVPCCCPFVCLVKNCELAILNRDKLAFFVFERHRIHSFFSSLPPLTSSFNWILQP